MNKKVFVTGGTGFLGSYILRLLLVNEYDVYALHRETSRMTMVEDIQPNIKWIEGDLSDTMLLDKTISTVDYVIHCAAVVSFEPKAKELMQEVNIQGTANIVNICLSNKKRLIHISSIASLGRANDGDHIDEKSKWEEGNLNSQYGISKYESELEVWRGIAEGLDGLIFNPSVIIGMGIPGEGTMPFFDKASKGFSFYSTGKTGFVDVRDVASLVIKGMESTLSSERIIANGKNVFYKYIFSEAAKGFSKKPPSIKVNKFLEFISWRIAKIASIITRKAPFITKETAAHSSKTYYYNNDKSIKLLDFKYRPLKQSIEDTVMVYNSYKESKNWTPLKF